MHGRIVYISNKEVSLLSLQGLQTVQISQLSDSMSVGDIVSFKDGHIKLLTKNTSARKSQKWAVRVLDQRRLHALDVRARVESGIKEFFVKRKFMEVKTPLLVKSPGMEPHIRPFKLTTGEFIPTSPEFAMKKLLCGGLERIFQICSAFRLEPFSPQHSPEFTILEWYRAYAGYEAIMEDFEKMVESLAIQFFGEPKIVYQGKTIDVKTPWPRLKVRDLFSELVNIDLVKEDTKEKLATKAEVLNLETAEDDSWDDIYFKIWLNLIEPKLPPDRAVFVYRYPASQSALSVIDQDNDGSSWARRFEPYAGGLELGNAFEELTDPVEQKTRFVEDMKLREKTYGSKFPVSPIDEEFLQALEEGMPPSGGIAVGVDRLVMLFANEPDIDYTLWLPPYREST